MSSTEQTIPFATMKAVNADADTAPAKLTKEQAAIVGAYTGFTAGPFADIQEYAEKVLGRPIWTHQFADEKLTAELREASKADFIAIAFTATAS